LGIRVDPPTRTTYELPISYTSERCLEDATNFVNIFLLHVGVLQDLDGFHGLPEEIHVEFFEFGMGKCLGEVIAILEALNFDTRALLARKCPLGLLNLTLEFPESAEILETSVPVFFL